MDDQRANKRKQMSRKQMYRKMCRKVSNVLSVCAVIVLVGCVAYLVKEISEYLNSKQTIANLRKLVANPVSVEESVSAERSAKESAVSAGAAVTGIPAAESVVSAEIGDETAHEYQEQFEKLHRLNNDLVGWIYMNESIDYPIVWRTGDNDYYMSHDFYGNESQAGWIFLDQRNANDMSDDQLIIYGHNMRLGEMFGELDLYRDLEYVAKHPIIKIQRAWEPEPRKYVLISLFDASMNKENSSYIKITKFNFENAESKSEYIADICQRSMHDLPCEATADDQLIMLVTCSYSHPNGRFLVIARELREDETEENIKELFAQIK